MRTGPSVVDVGLARPAGAAGPDVSGAFAVTRSPRAERGDSDDYWRSSAPQIGIPLPCPELVIAEP